MLQSITLIVSWTNITRITRTFFKEINQTFSLNKNEIGLLRHDKMFFICVTGHSELKKGGDEIYFLKPSYDCLALRPERKRYSEMRWLHPGKQACNAGCLPLRDQEAVTADIPLNTAAKWDCHTSNNA